MDKRIEPSSAIVTLTTDFGEGSPYVAAMKGVILSLNRNVQVIDLTHGIAPQDVTQAAQFLTVTAPYFPKHALHVVVVDPGVGTDRKLLYIECGGHKLLTPDNGVWTLLAGTPRVWQLTERPFWRAEISKTFHGRDILAPVAGHLTLGIDPALLGPEITAWNTLRAREPRLEGGVLIGEVVTVDRFGNLITNMSKEAISRHGCIGGTVEIGEQAFDSWVETYGDGGPGQALLLFSSERMLELAVRNGNAAQLLGVGRGTEVRIRCQSRKL